MGYSFVNLHVPGTSVYNKLSDQRINKQYSLENYPVKMIC